MSVTIDGIDTKVRVIEGTTRATPIGMKNLDDRINALGDKGKFAIRSFSIGKNVGSMVIPNEFQGWNIVVLEASINYKPYSTHTYKGTISSNGTATAWYAQDLQGDNGADKPTLSIQKSGNSITGLTNIMGAYTLKILFYIGTGY